MRWSKRRLSKEEIEKSENTIYLFGENDIDKYRSENQGREYIGGKSKFTIIPQNM